MTPEDSITAAEWVLGLLSGEELAEVEARLAQDAEFAEEVAWWQDRFAPLFDHYREVAPPAGLAARIEAMLDRSAGSNGPARLHWRSAGVGAAIGALAASLAAWFFMPATIVRVPLPPVQRAQPAPLLVARLAWSAQERAPAPFAIVQPDEGAVRLSDAIDVPDGRVAELWRIPAGETPISLGLLPSGGLRARGIARANVPAAGSTLAISIEPEGGSTTGQPTGPVIATGTLTTL